MAVELYADILAVYVCAFRGETGGARPGYHNEWQQSSVRSSHIRMARNRLGTRQRVEAWQSKYILCQGGGAMLFLE
jgi:hypothetical protein